jgi:hypothetical protein
VGIAATAVAALAFAVGAGRYALRHRRRSTFALMAVPVAIAAVWLGGLQLIQSGNGSIGHLTLSTAWLLLGLAGIAGATQAVVSVVKSTEFEERTWRIGGGAAAAVVAAMVVATGATITWSLVIREAMARTGGGADSLVITAIMAVTTVRAVLALISTRRAAPAADAPAVA